jgi:hypothetical protein
LAQPLTDAGQRRIWSRNARPGALLCRHRSAISTLWLLAGIVLVQSATEVMAWSRT